MKPEAVRARGRPVGIEFTAAVCLLIGAALLALAPLPALRTLARLPIPTGLDPIDGLVVAAVAAAFVAGIRLRRAWAGLATAAVLNLLLLLVAWARRYGHEMTTETLALYAHPLVVAPAGILGALLVGRGERRGEKVALVIGASLLVFALSVFAEAGGLYHPPVPALTGPLAVKPNGGFLLQGNEAGALFATYVVPCAVLLEAAGRRRLGFALLLVGLATLVVTESRESIGTFAVVLAFVAVLTGRIPRVRYAIVGLVAAVSVWAIAVPGAFAHLTSDTNSFLSGRPTLWRYAGYYLARDHHWLFGGGLDGFERYVQGTRLGHPFTTHAEPLRLLVDGGVFMLLGYVVLVVVLWRLARRTAGPASLALQAAVLSFVLIGLVKDFGPFTRPAAWLWVLAAIAVGADRRSTARPG